MSTTCLAPSEIAAPQFARYQVNSIADLRAIEVLSASFLSTTARFASVGGYYEEGDGGGQSFTWDADSAETDNGGTIIKPTNVSGAGRWKAVPSSILNAKSFGFRAGSNTYAAGNKTALLNMFSLISTLGAGTIIFPSGDFYINPSFAGTVANVPSNTTILLGKRTRLITYLNGDTNNMIMFRINRATNVHIRGGELVGDPASVGYGYGVAVVGTDANKSTNVLVENVVCRDWATDGFYVEDGTNIRLVDVESYDNARHGGSIVRGTNIGVIGAQFSGNGLAGFDVETEGTTDIEDVIFSRCRFKDNTDQGLYIQKGAGTGFPKRIRVDNCDFDGNGDNQLSATNTYDLILTGVNQFRNGAADSVYCQQVFRGRIGQLIIDGGGRGVYILASRDLVVDGFDINDTADNAVEIRDDSPTTYPTTRIELKNGNVKNSAEFGVYLIKGNDCRIENVRVNRIQKHGIAVGAGFGNAIINCHAYQCSMVTDNVYSGIFDGGVATKLIGNVARLGDRGSTATCQAGSTVNNAILHAVESDQNDIYNGYKIEILGGTGAGQVRYITDYVGSTVTASVSPAWTTAPHSDSVYSILPVGDEGVANDAAKSTAPNKQKYGIFCAAFKTFLHDNDTLNGGKIAGLQNSSDSSDAANNRS